MPAWRISASTRPLTGAQAWATQLPLRAASGAAISVLVRRFHQQPVGLYAGHRLFEAGRILGVLLTANCRRAAHWAEMLGWCAPPAWQATIGLQRIEQLIGSDYAAFAGRCYYLTRWLGAVRAAPTGEADTTRWRHLIDGLAAAGDSSAASLQRAEE